jgi:hypothetical protein
MRESIDPMATPGAGAASRWSAPAAGEPRAGRSARTHRADEFPAGYSSAGCSPAEPTSASPAASIMDQDPSAGDDSPANGNLSPFSLSHHRGSVHQAVPFRCPVPWAWGLGPGCLCPGRTARSRGAAHRSARGSESASEHVQSREQGAGIRQNSGQSERSCSQHRSDVISLAAPRQTRVEPLALAALRAAPFAAPKALRSAFRVFPRYSGYSKGTA